MAFALLDMMLTHLQVSDHLSVSLVCDKHTVLTFCKIAKSAQFSPERYVK